MTTNTTANNTSAATSVEPPVEPGMLRTQVREKYRDVALHPDSDHHFHTGRQLARLLGYPAQTLEGFDDSIIESFAGVGDPFSLHPLTSGEKVVDVGSGAGFDSFVAARHVGPAGEVVGVDMTREMLDKAWRNANLLRLANVDFREGLAESLPVDDAWADVVISNGVLNLCAEKRAAFDEIMRVLRPGGRLQFADIATGRQVPEGALRDIDLWTG